MTAGADQTRAALRTLARDVEAVRGAAEQAATIAGGAQARADAAHGLGESAHQAIARIAQGLAKVTRDVNGLAALISGGEGDDDEDEDKTQLVWLVLTDERRGQIAITSLVEWLAEVYLRYPGGRLLRECWAWHADVVAELLALQAGWVDAYQGKFSSPAKVLDWHERYRPGVTGRVNETLADCSLKRHRNGGDRSYLPSRVPGADQVGELASWWVASHGSTAAPAPSRELEAEEDLRGPASTLESRSRWE